MSHAIPDEALDDRQAFVGTSGSGKTYTAKGCAERLLRQKKRIVIVDPLGVWWGLRVLEDGKTPAWPVAIFGGKHGDLPLNEHSGALIGEAIATSSESCIVDLTDLKSAAARRRFMTSFLEALYERTNPDKSEPYHLIMDEADMFAPQKPMKGEEMLLHLTEEIVRRGRVKGFIPWLITQRPAVLNKNVLSQADGLIAMSLTSSQDRDAIGAWIEGQADRAAARDVLASLPKLQRGEGVVWLPRHGILHQVKFPKNKTFDSSRTPKRGEKKLDVKFKPLDIPALKERMEEVVEEKKANDPKEMRAKIATLQRLLNEQLKKAPAAAPTGAVPSKAMLEKAHAEGYAKGKEDETRWWLKSHKALANALYKDMTKASRALQKLEEEFMPLRGLVEGFLLDQEDRGEVSKTPGLPALGVTRVSPEPKAGSVMRIQQRPEPSPEASGDGSLSGPQQKILDAIAWWNTAGIDAPTRTQVAFVAGYKPSGTYRAYVGQLNTAGLTAGNDGRLELTDAGRSIANFPAGAPSTHDLHQRVLDKLSGPQQKILNVLLNNYPHFISRDDLAQASGYEPSGTFRAYVGQINSVELTEATSGKLRAAAWLFETRKAA